MDLPPTTELPPPLRVPVDSEGRLAGEVRCRSCGYNLRGLNLEQRCPECGVAVGAAVTSDLLRYSDPQWAEKVSRGLTLVLWMILLGILVGCASGAFNLLASVGGLIVQGVSYLGTWWFTTRAPGDPEHKLAGARKAVRVALAVGFGAQVLDVLVLASGPIALWFLASIASAVGGIAVVIGEIGKFSFYRDFARRIPHDGLAVRAKFLQIAYPASLGLTTIGGVVTYIMLASVNAGTPPAGPPIFLLGFSALGSIAILVFGVLTIILVWQLRNRVAAQARIARETWAARSRTTAQPDSTGRNAAD